MELPQKLKLELPYVPTIPLWGIFSEENKNINSKRYIYTHTHTPVFTAALFSTAKTRKQPSIDAVKEYVASVRLLVYIYKI